MVRTFRGLLIKLVGANYRVDIMDIVVEAWKGSEPGYTNDVLENVLGPNGTGAIASGPLPGSRGWTPIEGCMVESNIEPEEPTAAVRGRGPTPPQVATSDSSCTSERMLSFPPTSLSM